MQQSKFARHKFHATPTTTNGRRYASKLEARHADRLRLAQASGELLGWLEQVPFHLPGGVRHVVDFLEFWADGRCVFTETKGHETESYRAKKRIVEALYPWAEIQVVRR